MARENSVIVVCLLAALGIVKGMCGLTAYRQILSDLFLVISKEKVLFLAGNILTL